MKAEITNLEDTCYHYKFYNIEDTGSEDCWEGNRDNQPRFFYVREPQGIHLLLSNVNTKETFHSPILKISPLRFEFTEIPVQKADTLFDITLTLADPEGNAVSLNEPVMVELSVFEGTGNLGGILTKTMEAGETQIVFEGLTYDISEDNVVLQAEIISVIGEGLTFLSNSFDVFYLELDFEIIEEQEVDVPFAVTINSVDKTGNLHAVREDITVSLSVDGGTGNLGGEIIGILKKGESQLVFEEITYDKSEYQIYLIAEAVSENIGTSTILSNMFDVTGFDFRIASITDQEVDTPFAVTVFSLDKLGNIHPVREDVTIELSVNQGTGNLTGDLIKTLKKGETQLVFDNLRYDKVEENIGL